jgi:AcrR family transcriptional regulator
MGRPRVRDKILLAASELLAQKGVTGLTTRGVAQQAGVTETSIFNNFRDKAGLLQALLKEQMSEFTLFSETLAEPVEPDLSAWLGRVFIAAHNYFRIVLPLAGPQLSSGRPARTAQSREHYIGHTALNRRLVELQESGVIEGSADASAIALLLMGDASAIALLLMGAAMHSALTTATLGDDALGGENSLVQGVSGALCKLMEV